MSGNIYDPVANPYAPGAGTPPPALVGRDGLIAESTVALQRLKARRSTQHLLLTGLRGVGKTVLMGRLAAVAASEGFQVIRLEAVGGDDAIVSMLRQARQIADGLGGGPRAARALRAIDSVSLTIAGTGVRLDRGEPAAQADREALADVLVDIAAAASERDLGVMLAIDEAQILDTTDLRRMLAGVHRCGQDGLPIWCLLTGLPNLVGVVAKAATYAERLFTVGNLGPLTPSQVAEAVQAPAQELGVKWSNEALSALVDRSDGYPFFVQMWAYHAWNAAIDDPISIDDLERASTPTTNVLDHSFFAARIARIPESEVRYVRALASLGPGPHRTREVAAVTSQTSPQVSALRERLIAEGVVFAPRYGWVEFAIPHFDSYVRRHLPAIG